mgnify:CR=1 FL=1|jgi:hypothetical protein
MDTGLSILRHSMDVLQRHPRLLWFLAIDLLLGYLAYRFFFGPVFEASAGEWREAEFAAGARGGPKFPYLQVALAYLPGMFYATFINVALYSQILRALNGGQVSVRDGFRVAVARLPAIMTWSLMAGTVGLVLRLLQERVGLLGRWVLGLTGMAWSVATVFVVPVIINEPGRLRARDYLRISGSLVRRVWGEGVASLVSLGFMGIFVGVTLVALGLLVRVVTDSPLVAIYTVGLISALLAIAVTLLWRVFTCGLYVYATEGVAPDGFDEELMQRAWVVKSGSGAAVWPPAGTQPEVRGEVLPRKMVLSLLAAAGLMAGAVWLLMPELKPERREVGSQPFIGPQVGVITIDLAALDYELQYAHLQQAGLFTGRSRIGCDFPPEPTPKSLQEQAEGPITATLLRQGRFLHISFYGEEGPTKQRMAMATEGLRAIFPERAGSIYPEPSIPHVPRTTVAEWQPVKGAISYVLEMDCYHCCGKNRWCADQGRTWKVERNLSGTRHTFEWVGSQPGRWRVWSIDAEGRAGPKSAWTHFDWTIGACGLPG